MSSPLTTVRDDEANLATARAHLWILLVIAAAQLMVVLDTTIMIIALPSAQHALGFSNTDRQWVVTAYTLAFGGFLLLGGRISDMFGPKRTLMIGVAGFALASALGGAAQTTLMLIGARGLQGLFGALLAPSVLSILTSTFTEPRERGRAFGIYATIAIAGSAFGLILGGFLTQYVDWRWCLYVNLPIAALVLFGASTLIPTRQGIARRPAGRAGRRARVRRAGRTRLRTGRGRHQRVGRHRRHRGPRRSLAVLLASFVLWQSKGPNPLLPLRVVRNRNRAGSFLDDSAGRHRDVRDLPLLDLPVPDRRPLLPAQDRRRLPPADGHERAGGHAGGQPPDAPRADPAARRPRPAAGRAGRRPSSPS